MTQPIFSGAPTPVQGVTGGPGLPQGVASVDGSTGNVQISPPNNTTQFKKGSVPQSLQVWESDAGPTNFQRISLNAQTGGPFQLAVEVQPPGTIRDLQIIATGNIIVNTNILPSTNNTANIGSVTNQFLKLFVNNIGLNGSAGANAGPTFFGSTGAPSAATGVNGDLYFNVAGAALTTIWQKRAGAWVGIV